MSNEFTIKIRTIEGVKQVANICEGFTNDVDIKSGRYIVDAKSIMGILAFDLNKDLTIKIHSDEYEVINRFNEMLKDFKVV